MFSRRPTRRWIHNKNDRLCTKRHFLNYLFIGTFMKEYGDWFDIFMIYLSSNLEFGSIEYYYGQRILIFCMIEIKVNILFNFPSFGYPLPLNLKPLMLMRRKLCWLLCWLFDISVQSWLISVISAAFEIMEVNVDFTTYHLPSGAWLI